MRSELHSGRVEEVRINRLLADLGLSSRRGADELISKGQVTVNGQSALLGQKVKLTDDISFRGRKIDLSKTKHYLYLLLYKPRGITCTTDLRRRDNIISYLNLKERLFHVGRLGRDSEGLILLTNDGDIVNRILRVENQHEKEYLVTVDRSLTDAFLQAMREGVFILGQKTLPCEVRAVSERQFQIILKQGLNRQIRRMCEALGYKVKKLVRARIMFLEIDEMRPGDYRYLTASEERELLNLTSVHKWKN